MNATRWAYAFVAVAALALGAAFALVPSGASADNGVTNVQATTRDPTSVDFTARVTAPAGLEGATLVYRVLNPKEGDVGGRGEATFGPGPENDVKFTLETRTAMRYIPVGSIFRFHWEFTDAEGQTFQSEELEYVFLDGRYRWRDKQLGQVTVYWYGGNEDFADRVLQAGESALEETEALLQVKVPYGVRIMVWNSESDGELAMRPRSRLFDELVRTGGQRTGADLLFVFTATSDVVRHEMAHVVTAVAGDGPVSRIPSWLDEGTAVYMQRSPRPYSQAIAFRIQTDNTLRLRNMDSPANDPAQVDLFYGQSWSTVTYLLETYGEQAFADLYRHVREGSTMDKALEAVYGFDQDVLYNLWREDNGLDPIDFRPRVDSTPPPVAEATRPPLQLPTGGTSGSSGTAGDDEGDADAAETDDGEDDTAEAPAATATGAPEDTSEPAVTESGGGSNTTTAILVGVIALLLGGVLGVAALVVARSSRSG
ncbi:MAG: hypothetical protein F4X26_08585 [Chloroflexi bacterium]|nr:hypothetical protein [Chloroflexota bacterium]